MAGHAVATGLGHHGMEVEGLLVSVRQQHFCTVPGEMRHRQGQAALPEFVPENCQLQVTGTRGCWRSFRGALRSLPSESRAEAGAGQRRGSLWRGKGLAGVSATAWYRPPRAAEGLTQIGINEELREGNECQVTRFDGICFP